MKTWDERRAYMTALHRLKDECNRELDAVQVGDPHRRELLVAQMDVVRERALLTGEELTL